MLHRRRVVPPIAVALTLVTAIAAAVGWHVLAAHQETEDRVTRAELAERNRQLALLDTAPLPYGLDQPWQPELRWPGPLGRSGDQGLFGLGDFGEPVTDTRKPPLWQREPPATFGWRPPGGDGR